MKKSTKRLLGRDVKKGCNRPHKNSQKRTFLEYLILNTTEEEKKILIKNILNVLYVLCEKK